MFKCFVSLVKLSCELQTICALLFKVCSVVTLCEVGLKDMLSSSLSVCVGLLETVVCWVLFSHVTKQSRKGILPFSLISLVNWMLVFCLFKCSWNSSTGRNIPHPVIVGLVAFFVCGMLKSRHFGL